MPEGFILDTAHWLCDVDVEGGGWGIWPNDDDAHKPISGEVAYALAELSARDERVEAKLRDTQAYFSSVLDSVTKPRSVVHLCWVVLGSLACGISISDARIAALLEQLEAANREAWAWSLGPENPESCAIYPTYLALLVMSEARAAERKDELSLERAGIWLMNHRGPDLLWPSDPAATTGRRVLESAYAILGLYYAFSPEQFQESVSPSLSVLSEAALELPSNEAVVIEKPDTDEQLPDWHHCVIPQVAWTRLRVLGVSSELDGSPLPELLAKCVDDMWREEDRTWLDPSRELASPYLAADVLRVMTAYSSDLDERLVAPELAVRMVAEQRKAEAGQEEAQELRRQVGRADGYPYEFRLVGLSRSLYWAITALILAGIVAAGVLGWISQLTASRLSVLLAGAAAFVPLKRALGISGKRDTFAYLGAMVTIVAFAAVLVADWTFG